MSWSQVLIKNVLINSLELLLHFLFILLFLDHGTVYHHQLMTFFAVDLIEEIGQIGVHGINELISFPDDVDLRVI